MTASPTPLSWRRANYGCVSTDYYIRCALRDRIITDYVKASVESQVPDQGVPYRNPWLVLLTIPQDAVIPEMYGGWVASNRRICNEYPTAAEALSRAEEMLQHIRFTNDLIADAAIARVKKGFALSDQYANELDAVLDGRGYVDWQPDEVRHQPEYHCGTDDCYGSQDDMDGPVYHLATCRNDDGLMPGGFVDVSGLMEE